MTRLTIETQRLRIVQQTIDEVRAMVAGLPAESMREVSPIWLARVRDWAPGDQWTLSFAVTLRLTGANVGSCGFKAPPDADGVVEIAYGVSPDEEGKGYATEVAQALTAWACQTGEVRVVRAHTMANPGASARVLTKVGFSNVGQVVDPEDGLVWRWEKECE